MEEDKFWNIIAIARSGSAEVHSRNKYLSDILHAFSPKELVDFKRTMDRLFDELGGYAQYYSPKEIEHDYQPESPDAIKYLIISLGRDNYRAIKENPRLLYELKDISWSYSDLDTYANIDSAATVFSTLTNENLYVIIDTLERLDELQQLHTEKDIDKER